MEKKISVLIAFIFSILLIICIKQMPEYDPPVFIMLSILFSIMMIGLSFSLFVIRSAIDRMNKVKRIYLIISLISICLGVLSRYLHIAGASIELLFGVFFYAFSYAPLELKHKYLKWLPYSKSKAENFLLSFTDFIGFNFLFIGALFKMMDWPGSLLLIIAGISILVLGLFLWNNSFKNEVIKRKLSEEKIKAQLHEIQDSINYAKRIQNTILPSKKIIKEYLKDSFIFYRPKDIVAGDFYWMDAVGSMIYFAAADCTGHGVPGSIVSVMCYNCLNRSVREHNFTDPGQILDKTRELLISEFEKSDENVIDGMDIALCCIDGNVLKYSGANNPLWILRNSSNEIEEIKANKQPIGKYENYKSFTTYTTNLQQGDLVYIFSDGYEDQFGGELGKKFKAANFKKLLVSIKDYSMDDQKRLIEEGFDKWRGEYEQIDDICVIGLRK